MKIKVFKYNNEELFYKVNNADDLLDTSRFRGLGSPDIKTHLGMAQERPARQLAKRIFFEMMILIAYDMIFEAIYFVFPIEKWGCMGIMDTTDTNRADYEYNLKTRGTYLKPVLIRNKMRRYWNKFYYIRFNGDWRRSIWNKLERYGFARES